MEVKLQQRKELTNETKVTGGSMRKSGVGAGGGIGNRTIKHSQGGRKVEPKAMGIRPGHAGQIGLAQGNHATTPRQTT